MDINSWPGTVNLGSKLLVNGHIQYTNTGFAATTLTGRDGDGGLTSVGVGSGLSLASGTLSATDASISNEGTLGVNASGPKITSNTSGANGVTMSAGSGLIVATGGTNSNGGEIQYSSIPASYYSNLWRDGSWTQTMSSTPEKLNFSAVGPESGLSGSSSTDNISIVAGTYQITYNVGISLTSNLEYNCICTNNGTAISGSLLMFSNPVLSASGENIKNSSKTFLYTTGSSGAIDVRCYRGSGSAIEWFYTSNLTVLRIN